jgi:acetyltransferase
LINDNIIETFLNPKSVAVIGASKNPLKGGNRIVNNLVANNFKGKVYPINPNSNGKVFGLELKKSVLDIEDNVDLAVFYVPNHAIPDTLEECIKKGIKGAIIEASGFDEVGKKGKEIGNKIRDITDNFSKIRIVGPNCMGLTRIDGNSDDETDVRGGFFTSFGVFNKYKRGNIAVISQSGMLNGGYLMHVMQQYPDIGFRYSCSIGNKMDLSEIEFLEYLIEDPSVNVIAIYLESFKNPRRFIELCRKAKNSKEKKIIFVKGGVTTQGQKASLSHTAAMAEDSQLIDAVIKQAGVIHAYSFHELFQYARTLSMMYNAKTIFPVKGNVSMIAGSGGAGTISSDLTIKYGLKFPQLKKNVYSTLVEVFPDWMPPNKFALIDIWPAMEKAMMSGTNPTEIVKKVYETILSDPDIEGLFNMMFCSRRFQLFNSVEHVLGAYQRFKKPIFFWLIGEADEVKRISKILAENNLPTFLSLEEMVKNFCILLN